MPLSIVAQAKPAFFSRNWVGQDSIDYGTLTATENAALAKRLIDGDPLSLLNDTTATDGSAWTITASLSEKSLTPGKIVDLLLLQNINWKNFHVKYSDDEQASYDTYPGGDYRLGTADFAGTDLQLAPATSVEDATHIQIDVTHVQASYADKTKFIGGLIAAELKVQMARGFKDFTEGEILNTRVVELGDKSESEEHWLRSAQSHVWWRADGNFFGIPESDITALRAIRNTRRPFIFYPYPGDSPRAAYQCRYASELRPRRLNPAANGYELPVSVREVRA